MLQCSNATAGDFVNEPGINNAPVFAAKSAYTSLSGGPKSFMINPSPKWI